MARKWACGKLLSMSFWPVGLPHMAIATPHGWKTLILCSTWWQDHIPGVYDLSHSTNIRAIQQVPTNLNHTGNTKWEINWQGLLRQPLKQGVKNREGLWGNQTFLGPVSHVQSDMWQGSCYMSKGTDIESDAVATWETRDNMSCHCVPKELVGKMPDCLQFISMDFPGWQHVTSFKLSCSDGYESIKSGRHCRKKKSWQQSTVFMCS